MILDLKKHFIIKYNNGQKIGNSITIIRFDHRGEGHNYYICKCSCGKEFFAREKELESEIVTSCGHDKIIKLKDDLTGQEFTNLKVISFSFKSKDFCAHYLCQCKLCGRYTIVRRDALIKEKTTSCGCLSQNARIKRCIEGKGCMITSHSMSGTRFYSIWINIKSRCNNPNNEEYKNYGARGITYDPRWEQFINFYDDMYEAYCKASEYYGGEQYISIDRINVNGNYYKENCRWADKFIQARNRRDTINIKIGNETYCLLDAYNKIGHKTLLYGTVSDRISKYHSDPLMSLLLPIDLKSSHGKRKALLEEMMKEETIPLKYISGKKVEKYKNQLEELRKTNFWEM